MKAKICQCCKLVYLQRIKKAWVCGDCDRRQQPRDCRTIGQYMEIVGLAHKYASYRADNLTTREKGFIEMASAPELEQMKIRANQLRRYESERAFGNALKSGNIEKLKAMIEKLQKDLRDML